VRLRLVSEEPDVIRMRGTKKDHVVRSREAIAPVEAESSSVWSARSRTATEADITPGVSSSDRRFRAVLRERPGPLLSMAGRGAAVHGHPGGTTTPAVLHVVNRSPRRLGDVGAAPGSQVADAGQSEGHVAPGPQLMQDPVIPGVGLAAVEDSVVIHTEQIPGMEQEPRRAAWPTGWVSPRSSG
jgi:hypothetical protein